MCVPGAERRQATSDRRYIAIALAADERNGSLRDAVTAAVDAEARVLRTAAGVAAVCEAEPGRDAREIAEGLRTAVSAALNGERVTAGVAGPKKGSSGAHFALVQAEHALVIGRALHGEHRTAHFDDLGPYCFVLNQPAHEVHAFAERILGPLIADESHADLVDTLEAYLRTQGNLNAVARQLFLHRNTVRHRLRRIAKLTGADLDDPDRRLALQLAILGRRALTTRLTT